MTDNLVELCEFKTYLRTSNLSDSELTVNLYQRKLKIPFSSKITIDDISESICFLDDLITAKPYLGQAYISKTKFTFNKSKLEFEWKDFIVKVNDI